MQSVQKALCEVASHLSYNRSLKTKGKHKISTLLHQRQKLAAKEHCSLSGELLSDVRAKRNITSTRSWAVETNESSIPILKERRLLLQWQKKRKKPNVLIRDIQDNSMI